MIKFLLSLLLLSTTLASTSPPLFHVQTTNDQPLELIERKTRAIAEGPYAEIQYIYTYRNPFARSVEAKFLFDRSQEYIFNKFEATIANETITWEVHESPIINSSNTERRTNQVEIFYNEAKVTQEFIDIHMGSLHLNQTVEIFLSVIQPLETYFFQFYELRLPAHPHKNQTLKEWMIEIEIRSDRPLSILSNPTHRLKPELSQPTSKLYIASWKVAIMPNEDFVVYFAPERAEELQRVFAVHPDDSTDRLMLLSLISESDLLLPFESVQNTLEDQSENGILKMLKRTMQGYDSVLIMRYIFMLDRSDSMKGEPFEKFKRAFLAILQTLPEDTHIEILSFGSTFELYKINGRSPTIPEAMEWIETIQADMGEKNISKALESVVEIPPEEFEYQPIILLTEEEVLNFHEISEILKKEHWLFVTSVEVDGDKISLNTERDSRQFSIENSARDWSEWAIQFMRENFIWNLNFDDYGKSGIKCHDNQNQVVYKKSFEESFEVYENRPWTKWLSLKNAADFKACEIGLAYYDSGSDVGISDKITVNAIEDVKMTDFYHKIFYDMRIRELEKKFKENGSKKIKREIISLSTRYQIPSELTFLMPVTTQCVNLVHIQRILFSKVKNFNCCLASDYVFSR